MWNKQRRWVLNFQTVSHLKLFRRLLSQFLVIKLVSCLFLLHMFNITYVLKRNMTETKKKNRYFTSSKGGTGRFSFESTGFVTLGFRFISSIMPNELKLLLFGCFTILRCFREWLIAFFHLCSRILVDINQSI